MKTNNIYVIMLIITLIQFTWYYVTLPGSRLSPDKKYPRPSIKIALISYLTYVIPMLIIIYLLNSKDKNCAIANAYISLICKK